MSKRSNGLGGVRALTVLTFCTGGTTVRAFCLGGGRWSALREALREASRSLAGVAASFERDASVSAAASTERAGGVLCQLLFQCPRILDGTPSSLATDFHCGHIRSLPFSSLPKLLVNSSRTASAFFTNWPMSFGCTWKGWGYGYGYARKGRGKGRRGAPSRRPPFHP